MNPGDGTKDALQRRKFVVLLLVVVVMLGAAALWTASPMRAWLDAERVVTGLRDYGARLGPLLAVVGFAVALMAAVPLTFLTVVTLIAFGPAVGALYTILAAAIGGAASFGVGRVLGKDAVDQLAGPRLAEINQQLARRGVLAVALIRLVPIAPFALVNMVVGVSRISLAQFLIGSTLGLLPGLLTMGVFVDRIVAALLEPGPLAWTAVVLIVLLIVVAGYLLRYWLRRSPVR